MIEENNIVKRKILFYILSNIVCSIVIINFLSKQLMPVIYDYGKYQCSNFMTNIITYATSSQFKGELQEIIIVDSNNQIDINVAALNSVSCNIIMKSKRLLYELENGLLDKDVLEMLGANVSEVNVRRGIILQVPVGRAFDNILLNNIGVLVPVRYKLMGELHGQVTSVVKEYGINNSLIEINLEVYYKSKVSIPMISSEEENKIAIPLAMKIIQGEVPDYLLGTNILGGE